MLKIKFNERPKDLIYVPEFFNHTYEDEWLYDKDVIQIVKDIDNSELKGQCVISPALGSIAVTQISGGVKALILLLKSSDDFKLDFTSIGQNCVSWLVDIVKRRDIMVYMNGIDLTFRGYSIKALCLNDNEVTETGEALDKKMLKYVWEDNL